LAYARYFGTESEESKGLLWQHRKEKAHIEHELKATTDKSDQLKHYSAEY
jgi:hypothetical protein